MAQPVLNAGLNMTLKVSSNMITNVGQNIIAIVQLNFSNVKFFPHVPNCPGTPEFSTCPVFPESLDVLEFPVSPEIFQWPLLLHLLDFLEFLVTCEFQYDSEC